MMPDWFSLGVILYRLIVRKGPFDPLEEEYQQTDQQKAEWKKYKEENNEEHPDCTAFKAKLKEERNRRTLNEPPHPWDCNPETKDKIKITDEFKKFVLALLEKDPKKRLGYNDGNEENDFEEVLKHPVFYQVYEYEDDKEEDRLPFMDKFKQQKYEATF